MPKYGISVLTAISTPLSLKNREKLFPIDQLTLVDGRPGAGGHGLFPELHAGSCQTVKKEM